MQIFLLALIAIIAIVIHYNISISLLLLVVLAVLLFINKNILSAKNIAIFTVIFLAFFLRTKYIQLHNYSLLENKEGHFKIEIIKNINVNGDYLKGEALVNNEAVLVNYKIKSAEEKRYFTTNFTGGTLSIEGTIEDISEKKNYYDFDYKKYLARQNIFKKLTINNINSINIDTFSNKTNKLFNYRTKLLKNIENNLYFSRSGYFEALIFGYKNNLDIQDKQLYSELGISHLLAISGLHISFLVASFYYLFKKLNFRKSFIDIILILALFIYNILTGIQPSVLRASIMISLLIFFYRKNISALNSLLLTFLILLIFNPLYIFEIGFQFSFFITFCLIMSSDFLTSSDNKIITLFKTSLVSFFAGLPISIAHFYYFSPISIISNIIIVPYFTFLLFPSFLISYIAFLINENLFNNYIAYALDIIFILGEWLEEKLASISEVFRVGNQSNIFSIAILVLVIILLIYLSKKIRKYYIVILILISIFITAANYYNYNKCEKLSIANRDVYFIRDRNKTYLINSSNNYFTNDKNFRKKEKNHDIINEYNKLFNYEGIKKIDFLIITRKNQKDIGFSTTLISKNYVKKVILFEQYLEEKYINEILDVATIRNIPIIILKKDTTYKLDNLQIINEKDNIYIIKNNSVFYKLKDK